MSKNASAHHLFQNPLRQQLLHHQFFRHVRTEPLTRDKVATFIGQWWHPLHYFTVFLTRCVLVLPDVASKSSILKLLNQEMGEGNAARAHEILFIDTMQRAGFTKAEASESAPFPETEA